MQHRNAFTLVELLVVIGIMVLLTAMTIGAVSLTVTSERVRSSARLVQSKLEGARDRAIYAQEPRGVRLLVNEDILEDHDNNPATPDIPTICTSMAYVGSPGVDASEEDRDDVDGDTIVDELRKYIQLPDLAAMDALGVPPTDPLRRAVIGTNTNWSDLYSRGLIGPESSIVIDGAEYQIDPRSFPINSENSAYVVGGYGGLNGSGLPTAAANGLNPFEPNPTPPPMFGDFTDDEVIYLLFTDVRIPPVTTTHANRPWSTEALPYSIALSPDILPSEEPLLLPRGTAIDLQTSVLPPSWTTFNAAGGTQYSSKMDLLYSPGGGIRSESGIVHLHLVDIGDAMLNTPAGSTSREGDELGVTIFTRAGRANTHPMDGTANPWTLGIEGEVAR